MWVQCLWSMVNFVQTVFQTLNGNQFTAVLNNGPDLWKCLCLNAKFQWVSLPRTHAVKDLLVLMFSWSSFLIMLMHQLFRENRVNSCMNTWCCDLLTLLSRILWNLVERLRKIPLKRLDSLNLQHSSLAFVNYPCVLISISCVCIFVTLSTQE